MERRSVRFGVALLATVVALPVGGLSVTAPAANAASPVTVAVIDSEDGEDHGNGNAYTYVPPGDMVLVSGSSGGVWIELQNGGPRFGIGLIAPSGESLTVGAYEDAGEDPALGPAVDLSSSTSSCGSPSGRFDILEAPVFNDSTVTAFAADFEIRCDDATAALYGRIRVNSAVPIKAVKTSSDVWHSFGNQNIFVNSPAKVTTWTNVGNEPISLTAVARSGAYPDSFITSIGCTAPIAPGASCNVNIRARPTVSGPQSAVLTVQSDAYRFGRDIEVHVVGLYPTATNKTPATATTITTLPFRHAGALDGTESGGGTTACPGDYGALWYKLTRTTRTRITLSGESSEDGVYALQVFQGSSTGPLVACGLDAPTTFTAEPNVTYWIKLQRKYPGGLGLALEATVGPPDTTLEVSGVGVTLTTFYPYPDSYRDTVGIRGNRAETADVYNSIYNSAGTKVRGYTVPAGKGSYLISWNGRTASGTLLPAGQYRVMQRLTDVWGNRQYFNAYTALSNKRLYTYTFSKTFDAGSYNAYGKSGTGSLSRSASSYAGGLRLSTGTGGGEVAVGYQTLVPAATVYKSVRFQVLGRGNLVAGTGAETGVQDWTMCTSWDATCVDTWGGAPSSYGWEGHTVTGTRHVSAGRYVRGYVDVWGYGSIARWLDLQDVRLIVVYGILK
jgi:hypothetical protein